MHCGTERHHGKGQQHCGCGCQSSPCTCGCGGHGFRRFVTQEEKIAKLEEYLENLQKEAQAVKEHIAAIKGE